ncbi:MAG: global cell cycle regulator GcrA-like protein [Alphaproteobacteria bacterium]|nr:global cell cycle regulator GcrA-like protein [Alphaproteobacteria bacterium]
MVWTPEKIKQLKKLWQKGKSTVEIGRELGMSKNAVVGKVHRLELDARPSPIKKSTKKQAEKVAVSKEVPQHITLLDLRLNSCRWPIGEIKDPDFHFCGKDCQTGKPYCPEHCKIAYTSLKELTLQNAKNKKDRTSLTVVSLEEAQPDIEDTVSKKQSSSEKSTTKSSQKKEK